MMALIWWIENLLLVLYNTLFNGTNHKIFDGKYSMDRLPSYYEMAKSFSVIVDTTLTSEKNCNNRGDMQN